MHQPNENLPTVAKHDAAGSSMAPLIIATLIRRLAGIEPYDVHKIAEEHARLIAPIALRERKLAEAERRKLRAKYRAEHPVLTVVEAISVEDGDF